MSIRELAAPQAQHRRWHEDAATRHLSAYDPALPWDSAIAASTSDWEFWSDNFHNKALKHLAVGRSTGPTHATESTGQAGSEGGGAPQEEAQRPRPGPRELLGREHRWQPEKVRRQMAPGPGNGQEVLQRLPPPWRLLGAVLGLPRLLSQLRVLPGQTSLH